MKHYANKEEIISLLRAGEMILCDINESFGQHRQTVYKSNTYAVTVGNSSKRVHHSTISAMIRNKIINGPDIDKSICYKLI